MKGNTKDQLARRIRRAVMAIVSSGIAMTSTVHANPSDKIVGVPPTELPELARQPGEAMLLRNTIDCKAILYVEQMQGARLAIFDVTDPMHIKGEGSAHLGAGGPFDFVTLQGPITRLGNDGFPTCKRRLVRYQTAGRRIGEEAP